MEYLLTTRQQISREFICLVVYGPTPLKNDGQLGPVGMIIPNIWKVTKSIFPNIWDL